MTASSVIMALQFNANRTWFNGSSSVDYPISVATDTEKNDVRATIRGLYNMAMPSGLNGTYSTVGAALEGAISRDGFLRIAHSNRQGLPDYAYGPPAYHYFIAVDESRPEWAVGTDGILRQADPRVAFAHELGHYLVDSKDAYDPYMPKADAERVLNGATFDYVGSSVVFENAAAKYLGLGDYNRASYTAGLVANDPLLPQFSMLQGQTDFTGGSHVDIVRFGFAGYDNNMDLSARTDKLNALIVGFDGQDKITGTSNKDFLYGGTGEDVIHGGAAADHIYGQEDSDQLYGDGGNDVIIGGGGSDNLVGGGGNDTLVAAHGGDAIHLYPDDVTDRTVTKARNGASTDDVTLDGGTGQNVFYANSLGTTHVISTSQPVDDQGGNVPNTIHISAGAVDITADQGFNDIEIDYTSDLKSIVFDDRGVNSDLWLNTDEDHRYSIGSAIGNKYSGSTVFTEKYNDGSQTTYYWNGTDGDDCSIVCSNGFHLDIPHFHQFDWGIYLQNLIG